MSNIQVTTTQNVIDVTNTSGITVTTPEGQTIAVTVPNSTVNVTNTTDDITILTAGTLNINTGNAVTSVNGIPGPTVVLTTTNINEGTNLYYTTARQNTDFDTRLATKTTTNLAEGTNLYYTTARQNTDFDARLATKTTDNLTEGTTNKYFSQALARQSLSAGTGISYDNATGVITNTSINTDTTYTIDATTVTGGANLNLVGSDATTDSVKIAGGTNVTVTRTDANTINIASTDTNTTYTQNASATSGGANLNLVGSDSTTDTIKFAEGTGITVVRTDADTITITNTVPDTNTTYTQNISSTTGGANLNLVGSDSTTDTVKFADGAGVTVSYTDANTATIAIGQDVATTANPTFAGATLGNVTVGLATDQTISTTTGDLVLNSTSGTITMNSAGTLGVTLNPITGFSSTGSSISGTTLTIGTLVSGTIAIGQLISGGTTLSGTQITAGSGSSWTVSISQTVASSAITGTYNPNADFTGNIVKGALRTGNGEATGDIYQISGTFPHVGISIDNSDLPTKRSSLVLRNYGGSLASGLPRNPIWQETARGSAATPLNVGVNDTLGETLYSGYSSTGWLSDLSANAAAAVVRVRAAENWNNGLNNVGTQFLIIQQPTATPLNSSSLIATFVNSPQSTTIRSDFIQAQNKAGNNLFNISSNGNVIIPSSTPTVNGAQLNISAGAGLTAGGGAFAQLGDVNITQFSSSWQSVYTPGFKYTGLASSAPGNTTGNGTAFEMSARWKATAASTTFVPPQNGWGLGSFQFSADNSTNNTSQRIGGQIRCSATEDWTSTATGTKMTLDANRIGTLSTIQVLSASPDGSEFNTDVLQLWNPTTQLSYGNGSIVRLNSGNPAGATFNDRTSQIRVTTASTSVGDASTIVFATNNYNTGTNTYSPTNSGDTLGEFFFSGNYATGGGAVTLGPSVRFAAQAAENFTGSNAGGRFVISADKIGGSTQYDALTIDSSNANIRSNTITLEDNNSVDYAVLNSTSATFAQPVGLPVKTAAQWNAITGAVGRMVCVSDSAQGSNPNGMIAFWDTTHSRWSYIHDNGAV